MTLTTKIGTDSIGQYREFTDEKGNIAVARKTSTGSYRVTAHANDEAITEAVAYAFFNESGFRGRQWENSADGQQYPTLKAIVEDTIATAVSAGKWDREVKALLG